MKIGFVKGAIASLVLFTLGSVPAFSQNIGGEIVEAAEMILPDSIDGIEYFRTDHLEVNELSVMRGELQLANGLRVTGDGDFRGDVLVAGKLTVAGNPYFTGLNESVEVPGVIGIDEAGQLVRIPLEKLKDAENGELAPCATDPDGVPIDQDNRWYVRDNAIFTNPCTVNPVVGIGTDEPRETLDVIGSGIVTQTLAIGRSTARGTLDAAGQSYFGDATRHLSMGNNGQDAFIDSESPTGNLLVNYNSNNNLVVGKNATGESPAYIDVAGKGFIGHTLRVGNHSFYNGANQEAVIELGDNANFIKNTRNVGVQIAAYQNTGITIKNSGGVGIGESNPQASLHIKTGGGKALLVTDASNYPILQLQGDILYSREVNVQMSAFPDYVFSDHYKLRDLKSVQTYIRENGRLPKMPSAETVEKEGANLSELNKLLVEKVEELTLYLIDQQEEIEALKAKVNALEKAEQ